MSVDRPNTTHKLVIMWNVTLRVCLNSGSLSFWTHEWMNKHFITEYSLTFITHWLKLKLVNFRILSADSRAVSWFPLIVAVNFSYFRYFWEKNSPERRLRTFSATRIPTGIFPFYSGPGATNSGRKMTFFNVRSLEKAEMARYQKRFLDILIKPPCLPKIPEIHRHLDTA